MGMVMVMVMGDGDGDGMSWRRCNLRDTMAIDDTSFSRGFVSEFGASVPETIGSTLTGGSVASICGFV